MRQTSDRGVLALLAVAACVVAPLAWEGGLAPAPRWVFVGLAVAAAMLAGARPSAPVAALLVLGALNALSALWTVGLPADAVRWGGVIAGYGLLAGAAAAIARAPRGAAALTVLVCVAAAGAGAWGLVALATHGFPYAERIEGRWRPGGPLEYPPALALLQVCALPALVAGVRRGGATRWGGAAGLAVAVGVLVLAGNRTAWSLAAAAVVWVLCGRRWGAWAMAGAVVLGAVALVTGHGHGRPELWHEGLQAWQRRPVAGHGGESFAAATVLDQPGATIEFAHSLPVEWLVELGVLGLLAGLAVLGTTLRAAWRGGEALLAPAVAAFLLASLVDWPWQLTGAGAVWAVALGATIAAAQQGGRICT